MVDGATGGALVELMEVGGDGLAIAGVADGALVDGSVVAGAVDQLLEAVEACWSVRRGDGAVCGVGGAVVGASGSVCRVDGAVDHGVVVVELSCEPISEGKVEFAVLFGLVWVD
nr:hypothetical protein [uncultured bacterium]